MKHLKTLLVGAGVLLASTGLASAATATGNLNVALTLNSSCSVAGATLTFPNSSSLAAPVQSAAAVTVNVTCSAGTSYTLAVGSGGNRIPSGDRQMAKDGGAATDPKIPYKLSRAAGGIDEYLPGVASASIIGTGAAQAYSIFGFVPAMVTTPSVGTYKDTVVITIDY